MIDRDGLLFLARLREIRIAHQPRSSVSGNFVELPRRWQTNTLKSSKALEQVLQTDGKFSPLPPLPGRKGLAACCPRRQTRHRCAGGEKGEAHRVQQPAGLLGLPVQTQNSSAGAREASWPAIRSLGNAFKSSMSPLTLRQSLHISRMSTLNQLVLPARHHPAPAHWVYIVDTVALTPSGHNSIAMFHSLSPDSKIGARVGAHFSAVKGFCLPRPNQSTLYRPANQISTSPNPAKPTQTYPKPAQPATA